MGLVVEGVAVGQAFCEYCSVQKPYYSANALHTHTHVTSCGATIGPF